MELSIEELAAMGFSRAGTVRPDATSVVLVDVTWDYRGYAVYAMRVGSDVKKFGTTGRKNSSFKARMGSTFSALRQTIRRGAPFEGDPFKRGAPAAVLAKLEIELWLKPASADSFEQEETLLNTTYRPEWTKEGSARA